MQIARILPIISFGIMCFCVGWLFDAYIMSERAPLGSLADYRKIAVRCLGTMSERTDNLDKFLSVATHVVKEEDKKE